MKKVLALIIIVLFMISCSPKEEIKEPICKAPYFEWKQGECCLDANNNFICDWDETKTEELISKKELEEKEKNFISEFLKNTPDKYWFHSYNTGKVVVNKEKRHSYVNIDKGITDIYWDENTKKAWELCDIEEEIVQEGDSFQKDRPICNPDFLNIRELTAEEYKNEFPLGPIDWMLKYKDKEPFLVEESIQTLGVRTVSPVLHFKEDDGTITVLKFDYHFKVPISIDTLKNNMRTNSIKFLYDTNFKLIGIDDADNAVILPKEKPMPLDPILIVLDKTELLLSNDVYVSGKLINQGYDYLEPQKILIECFDDEGNLIGDRRSRTVEGITKHKDTEFKVYVPVKNRDFAYCTAALR